MRSAAALVFPPSRLLVFYYIGALGLIALELLNVWLIMPMLGSQRMRSVRIAYAVYRTRWAWRALCGALLLAGLPALLSTEGMGRWVGLALLPLAALAAYAFNFRMKADRMFRQPSTLTMLPASDNRVAGHRLVVAIEVNGEARAYPLMFIGYHHQVRDVVGGEEVLVSYCTVCRTGRVFSPLVNGRAERFRLVGMDHFNAMFEDATTGSWWRQANGEAITGPRTGAKLAELPSRQLTLDQWIAIHQGTLVMQGDSSFAHRYPAADAYETGTSRGALTGTDTASWGEKSWVVGIAAGGQAKAYDWNRLKRERIINDEVAGIPIVLVLAPDDASFFAYRRPDAATRFALEGDTLAGASARYALSGVGAAGSLEAISASQEFWHSWRTFQPATERY
jgi:hypothetical protein